MSSLLEESYIASGPSSSTSTSAKPGAPLIPTFQRRRAIAGTPTELVVQTFDDRILVIVTQVGKVGCFIQASLPSNIPLPPPLSSDPPSSNGHTTSSILSSLPVPPPGISLTPLFGTPPNQALYQLYASQISTILWWTLQVSSIPRRPVVLGLALARGAGDEDAGMDEQERERFAGVMALVSEWEG